MTERFRIRSDGDLEAVTIAETYRLLSEVFDPYCFTVSGPNGSQQAIFATHAHHILFVTYLHEFVAESTDIAEVGGTAPRNVSLLGSGLWLIDRNALEAQSAGWSDAAERLVRWLDRPIRLRFWSGEIQRHLEYTAPFKSIFSAHANLLKHGLLKLGPEINRLRSRCASSNVSLTEAETVSAIPEYAAHLEGMFAYHATEIAELTGHYFHGLYRFVRARWQRTPTNNLDLIPAPAGVTDDVFRYLYAATLHSFSAWTEDRIRSSIPTTGPHFKPPYPQHEQPDPNRG